MKGTYRGFLGSQALLIPQCTIGLVLYETLKSFKDKGQLPSLGISLPVLTAIATSVVSHPLDSLRKRLMLNVYGQNQQNLKAKPLRETIAGLSAVGYKSLFSGMTVNLVRNAAWLGLLTLRQSDYVRELEKVE